MAKGVEEIKARLKEAYEAQIPEKKFDFDFECLECSSPAEHFKTLRNMCFEAGLGKLKIDEYLANYAYTRNL